MQLPIQQILIVTTFNIDKENKRIDDEEREEEMNEYMIT